MIKTMLRLTATMSLAVFVSTACAVEVKLTVTETSQVARSPAVITTGVPFARGVVREVGKLMVTAAGKPVPAQFAKTAAWNDGSVRWALMDVQLDVPAGGKAELVVSDGGGNVAPAAPAKVDDAADTVRVSTGPLQFVVNKKKFNLFESLKVDGKELITSHGRGLVLVANDGREVVAPAEQITVEQAGPVRAVVCIKGRFPGVHSGLLSYTVRITAFAGQKFVKVHAWLENNGAMGYFQGNDNQASSNVEWFTFDGLAVELGLGLGGGATVSCEGVESPSGLKVFQTCKMTPKPVAKNQRAVPPFFTWDNFEYRITRKAVAATQPEELEKGDRTDGVVTLKGPAGTLTAAIRDFWQNYEKAIEADGQSLRLWLWPTEGQWPRINRKAPFDKSLDNVCRDGMYSLAGGVHKGHEFILDFSGRDPAAASAELSSPLMALAPADYYATTEAAPGLFAPPDVRTGDRDCDAKLDSWMRMTRSAADPANPTSIFKARQVSWFADVGYSQESALWFGWMDFGELLLAGHGSVSLHYDWPWIMLLNALRTGDANFMRLGTDMARHRIDVDQLWSDRDIERARGLQRGGYNWPNWHCYRLHVPPGVGDNQLAGVVLYYMLTGEPKALECCQRNANGLKESWAWIAKAKPWAGPQGDMAAHAWAFSTYGAMYDLTGEKKWLDEALALFRADVVPKWNSLGPFLHDATHQIQSQDYIQDDMKYCYAIQSLCELHHRTGDAEVLKLLAEGAAKEFPESFFEAPVFLSGLYAYVGCKTGNKALLTRAAESFSAGFPESKSPPVFLPDNSTWTRQAAMTLRTGHLLQYAWWKAKESKPK